MTFYHRHFRTNFRIIIVIFYFFVTKQVHHQYIVFYSMKSSSFSIERQERSHSTPKFGVLELKFQFTSELLQTMARLVAILERCSISLLYLLKEAERKAIHFSESFFQKKKKKTVAIATEWALIHFLCKWKISFQIPSGRRVAQVFADRIDGV